MHADGPSPSARQRQWPFGRSCRRHGEHLRASACICGSIFALHDRRPAALQTETEAALAAATDLRAWDAVRVATLGRNGRLTALLRDLGKAPPEQRRERGAALNRLKDALTAADRGPPRRTGERRTRRPPGGRAPRSHPAAAPARDRPDPPDQPHHGGDRRDLRRHGLRDRRRPRRRIRLDEFLRAQHPGASSRARRPGHVLPAAARQRSRRRCCARRPRRCRSAPCWRSRRRSASSSSAAPTAPTTTRRTRRCSTSARA